MREVASPMAPSLEAIVNRLTAMHPADRPHDAHEVLAMLGRATAGDLAGAWPPPIGRDRDLAWLLDVRGDRVRYVVGPAGSGKSHLLEEALLRALLEGRHARKVTAAVAPRLSSFLRGSKDAWPFASPSSEPTLLVVDDLDRLPSELAEALIAHRCRATTEPVVLIVSAQSAPAGAAYRELGPLDDANLALLCAAVDVRDVETMKRLSGGLPGLVVAAAGRAPLSQKSALERVQSIGEDASLLLASIALAGGSVPRAFGGHLLGARATGAERELLNEGLLTRAAGASTLFALALSAGLAEALGSCARVDLAVGAGLALEAPPPALLLALARSPYPPT